MISCQFGSWKQVLTDLKAHKPCFHAKVAIYEKGLYSKSAELAMTFAAI